MTTSHRAGSASLGGRDGSALALARYDDELLGPRLMATLWPSSFAALGVLLACRIAVGGMPPFRSMGLRVALVVLVGALAASALAFVRGVRANQWTWMAFGRWAVLFAASASAFGAATRPPHVSIERGVVVYVLYTAGIIAGAGWGLVQIERITRGPALSRDA